MFQLYRLQSFKREYLSMKFDFYAAECSREIFISIISNINKRILSITDLKYDEK